MAGEEGVVGVVVDSSLLGVVLEEGVVVLELDSVVVVDSSDSSSGVGLGVVVGTFRFLGFFGDFGLGPALLLGVTGVVVSGEVDVVASVVAAVVTSSVVSVIVSVSVVASVVSVVVSVASVVVDDSSLGSVVV